MSTLTIITPTFNRANLIKELFYSLEKQSNKDFEWLVVDDGSTDNTEELFKKLINSASFEIRYLKKSNGGKHTALNYGIREIESELTLIVDSDDVLTEDSVDSILNIHAKYKNDNNIGSYTFLKGTDLHNPVVSIEGDEFVDNYIKYRIKNDRPGDMAEVFKTKYLKRFPFPEFEGEKFISEDVVWIEIGKVSDSLYVNKIIYICTYLDGGLTANDKPMKFSSPCGSMMRGIRLMSVECGLKANIKGSIIYNVYKKEAGEIKALPALGIRERLLTLATSIFTSFFYRKWHA